MEENKNKSEDKFNVLDDEPTESFSPVSEAEVERKEEIIPLYKRHVFTLIIAAVIIFIFGGILGYSFGKNAGKREVLDERFNLIAEEKDFQEKMIKPISTEPIINLTSDDKKPSSDSPQVSPPSTTPTPEKVEKPKPTPAPPKQPAQPSVSNDSLPPPSPFIESTEVKDKYIQIASFKEKKQAEDAKSQYESDGYKPVYIQEIDLKDKGIWYRVILGPVTLSSAQRIKTEFAKKYKIDILIK
ncbi:MAG TPA: SPOR domain-containing protein [Firmicutes bacterium]|nr:SPOR domain-containing protein [Bacillota bacterium]